MFWLKSTLLLRWKQKYKQCSEGLVKLDLFI